MNTWARITALPLILVLLAVALSTPNAYGTVVYPLQITSVEFIDIATGDSVTAEYTRGESVYIKVTVSTTSGYVYVYSYATVTLSYMVIAAVDYPGLDVNTPDTQIFYLLGTGSMRPTREGIEQSFVYGFSIPTGASIPTGRWNVRVFTWDNFPWVLPSNAYSLPDNQNYFTVVES